MGVVRLCDSSCTGVLGVVGVFVWAGAVCGAEKGSCCCADFLGSVATGCFGGPTRECWVTVADGTVLNFTSRGSLITKGLRTADVVVGFTRGMGTASGAG